MNYSKIFVEDLAVAEMVENAKTKHIARAISDVNFGELRRQLSYKTRWYGSELVVRDRYMPSSKKCSGCGFIKNSLSIKARVYRCEACGLEIDRDLNAAKNLAI